MKFCYLFVAIVFIVFCINKPCHSHNEANELAFIISNNSIKNDIRKPENATKHPGFHSIFTGSIRFYQLFISTQDRPVCNFTPSCSQFGIESIRKFGIIKGIMLTSDRLQRCNGTSVPYYRLDYKSGRFIDPVKNYSDLTKKQT